MKNKIIIALFVLVSISFGQECIRCNFVCKPDSELTDYDSALCINKDSVKINAKYLKGIEFNKNGLDEWYCGEKYKHVFINKKGEVVVWGIATIDNGADYVKNGLVRIIRNNKWGYAKITGEIFIKPTFDGALPFENGKGTACVGCKDKCVKGSNCEYHYFSGGQWFEIDTLRNIKQIKK